MLKKMNVLVAEAVPKYAQLKCPTTSMKEWVWSKQLSYRSHKQYHYVPPLTRITVLNVNSVTRSVNVEQLTTTRNQKESKSMWVPSS